jgi:hypothetical protein
MFPVMRFRVAAIVTIVLLGSLVAGRAGTTGVASAGVVRAQPCGSARAIPRYQHVIWIWMENHSYDAAIGASAAPFTNGLAAHCGLATNYHNITHPSLPNYIAATSGGTQGITDDCQPSECPRHVPNLFAQLRAAHISWASYQESMPRPCGLEKGSGGNPAGEYAPKHNPAVYYLPRTACNQRVVPLGTPGSGAFARALKSNALPGFSFVTPNLCNDTHDCPVSTGDRWLSRWMGAIVSSRAYRAGHTVVFVLWDEGEGGGSDNCTTNTSDSGCHIPNIVVSPSTKPGTRSPALFSHYSLLKTTEELLGVPASLGHAHDPSTRSMRAAFHI